MNAGVKNAGVKINTLVDCCLTTTTTTNTIKKRPLKAFVRIDGSGRKVNASLIWRKKMPKVGKWVEVDGYECCNGR